MIDFIPILLAIIIGALTKYLGWALPLGVLLGMILMIYMARNNAAVMFWLQFRLKK